MKPEHDPRHAELLAAVLGGERDADEREVRELLAHCPRCREELGAMERIPDDLERAGHVERDLARAARDMRDAPGEAQVLSVLRAQAGLESREPASRAAGHPSERWWRALAAAALLIAVGAIWLAWPKPPQPEDAHLGAHIELLAPAAGARDAYDRFAWKTSDPRSSRYECRVFDGQRELTSGPVACDRPEWKPDAQESARWPARITLEIRAYDGSNQPTGFGAFEVSRSAH